LNPSIAGRPLDSRASAREAAAAVTGKRFLCVLLLAVPLFVAAPAHAYVYWADPTNQTIGRANNDGSGANDAFIHAGQTPFAVAVDASHVYWADQKGGSIGRANIDGSEVNDSFIAGIAEPSGVAVNNGFVYWSSLNGNRIGRAKLDGTEVISKLVEAEAPCGIALDSGHVYWASDSLSPQHIGRASLAGTEAAPTWVTVNAPGPCGLAVNSANVFWDGFGFFFPNNTTIGRASINTPGSPDNSFIGDASGPCGLALDTSSHLYWANAGSGTIGRSRTDGTEVNESFIATGGHEICGVAVDNLSPPPAPAPGPPAPTPPKLESGLQLGALKRNLKKGTALLTVDVGGPGTVTLSGKGVTRVTKTVQRMGFVKLAVKAKGGALRTLHQKGKVSLKVTVVFVQTGDAPATRTHGVVLRLAG
jgi:virginiamycin B lyase